MIEKGFHWSHKAHYGHVVAKPQILFGLYDTEGGTDGEMAVRWHYLGSSHPLAPRLEVFSDALNALASFTDLIQEMAKLPEDYTEEEFVEVLKKCGFKDLTEY